MKTITKFIYSAFAVFAFAWLALLSGAQAAPEKAPAAPQNALPGFNTADGDHALFSLTTGVANAAFGWYSLFSNTDGSGNTAVGAGTLVLNVGDQSTGEGVQNTAVGAAALLFNTTGYENTAVGATALLNNTEGFYNTASGVRALYNNTTGVNNTATGFETLLVNNGSFNTAAGQHALYNNNTGNENTATGNNALFFNTEGNDNTADGADALFNNATGDANVAVGWVALHNNVDGTNNTAVGAGALQNNISNGNIALGTNAGANLTTGQFNIDIGNEGVADEAGTIRIGDANHTATYIAGISGQTATDGVAVYVNSDGKLGTLTSSARFKKEIKPMDKTSEAILALKPVNFQYKSDSKATPQFGLIAEEVAEVNPDLVVRDSKGEIYSVRYEAVNAMLLNEFLKEHRKVEQLTKDFEAKVEEQQKQIEALTAGLQKVSAQIEMSRPAPQVVKNR